MKLFGEQLRDALEAISSTFYDGYNKSLIRNVACAEGYFCNRCRGFTGRIGRFPHRKIQIIGATTRYTDHPI
jgi:hypothetical protein